MLLVTSTYFLKKIFLLTFLLFTIKHNTLHLYSTLTKTFRIAYIFVWIISFHNSWGLGTSKNKLRSTIPQFIETFSLLWFTITTLTFPLYSKSITPAPTFVFFMAMLEREVILGYNPTGHDRAISLAINPILCGKIISFSHLIVILQHNKDRIVQYRY